jgi:hypothetical protein
MKNRRQAKHVYQQYIYGTSATVTKEGIETTVNCYVDAPPRFQRRFIYIIITA